VQRAGLQDHGQLTADLFSVTKWKQMGKSGQSFFLSLSEPGTMKDQGKMVKSETVPRCGESTGFTGHVIAKQIEVVNE
jgi:hypothetical protein